MKQWSIKDEIYTMIWYYESELKEIKDKRHDAVIRFNQTKKLKEKFPELQESLQELYNEIAVIEEELSITKSLLRRLKKIAEMYDIKY